MIRDRVEHFALLFRVADQDDVVSVFLLLLDDHKIILSNDSGNHGGVVTVFL